MKADPKMRRVARAYVCAVCEQPLNEVAVKNEDPFCTVTCCREFHGTQLPNAAPQKSHKREEASCN